MTIDLIIVRLLPSPPTDAATFRDYIRDLSIQCFDQNITNVDESTNPTGANQVLLGEASGLLSFSASQAWDAIITPIDIPDPEPGRKKKLPKSIIQHTAANVPRGFPQPPTSGVLKAVATAVIVVDMQPPDAGAAHKEYPKKTGYDVRLVLKRSGVALEAPSIEWNATCYTVRDLSPYAVDYMGIANNPIILDGFPRMTVPSLYALIPSAPSPLPAGTAAILLQQNGNPPPFDELVNGVNLVLAKYDLDTGTRLQNLIQPLTEAQSQDIASEIVYNRAWLPLPSPVPEESLSLEDLYTSPGTYNDMTRTKFEGNLAAYHAKLDADARRLASYIFAASAAVAAERLSAESSMALLTFPLDARMVPSTQPQSSSTNGQSTAQLSVVLTSWDAFAVAPPSSPAARIDPSFVVPAAYFYALGYQLSPTLTPELRYRALVNSTPEFIKTTVVAAVGAGILGPSESTVTQGDDGGNVSINTAQAVRRLCALLPNVVNMLGGLTASGASASTQLPQQPVLAMALVSGLVALWRDFDRQDQAFWTTDRFSDDAYLNLILQIAASGDPGLKPAIASAALVPAKIPPAPPGSPPTVIRHAYELHSITTEAWKDFFLSGTNPPSLPAWTAPGDVVSRVEAFVRRLQMLFFVTWQAPSSPGETSAHLIPVLDAGPAEFNGLPSDSDTGAGDLLAVFLQSATGFSFEGDWDDDLVQVALLAAFPDPSPPNLSSFGDDGTEKLRRWLGVTLKTLWTLVHVTNLSDAASVSTYRRFAYMEALYSRGFVSADGIVALSVTQFAAGLSGTIIEPVHVPAIHALAVALPHSLPSSGIEPGWGFVPANPGGAQTLVNCIPAPTLDPLGRVAYLHEILRTPLKLHVQQDGMDMTVKDLLSTRRGDIGSLYVSKANLETTIPLADLAIESLEAVGAMVANDQTAPHGIVHQTTSHPAAKLLGLCLSEDGQGQDQGPGPAHCCPPGLPSPPELLAAIPEHSHPAIQVARPGVYHRLESTFTSPALPFARHLDMTRSYLACVGTRRFDTMRRFRRDITEFALDPSRDPPEWQAHAWRFPVRIEIGLEYLGLSKQEYATLYTSDLDEEQVAGLYGLSLSESSWTDTALKLHGFMRGLDLTYCDVLKLKASGYVDFTLVVDDRSRLQASSIHPTHARADTNHGHGESDFTRDEGEREAAADTVGPRDCPPCCLDIWRIRFPNVKARKNTETHLKQLAVFVRLWRTLNAGCRHKLSFRRLADICTVLQLFGDKEMINPAFIRRLVALLMLADCFGLPWSAENDGEDCLGLAPDSKKAPGSARTEILALWDPSVPRPPNASPAWDWAVSAMIDVVQRYAEREYHVHAGASHGASPKILAENLSHLARLAGFSLDAAQDPSWHFDPVCTLRFAEVLAKICASRFTVGELLFLFTVQDHVDGDDPFPIAPQLETASHPLSSLPDDELEFSLEALRKTLLRAEDDEDECAALSDDACDALDWSRVQGILHDAGYTSFPTMSGGTNDALQSLAEHFFPSAVARSGGRSVDARSRQWTAPLDPLDTSPAMWAADPCGPLHYRTVASEDSRLNSNSGSGELYVALPLRDDAVLAKLRAIRQLRPEEARAVQELYFAPRAALAPFALLFRNFGRAVEHLVQADECARWRLFAREVLVFERRVRIIARHIAVHVRHVTNKSRLTCTCEACGSPPIDTSLAITVLRHLVADENRALAPWENDSGAPPDPEQFQWGTSPRFSGGALAGLLGIAGTGLAGEIHSVPGANAGPMTDAGMAGANKRWEEIRGGLKAFGLVQDRWNCPVPTVIPDLETRPSGPETREAVSVRNGFAWRNRDGCLLQGAEPFDCEWTGTLLVECSGCYVFSAGAPCDTAEGLPGRDGCDSDLWSVTLKRGQKTYKLLRHDGGEHQGRSTGPSFVSDSVQLHQGAYAIHVVYRQVDPHFSQVADAVTRERTGFEVRYQGPQTKSRCILVPLRNLVIDSKQGPMGSFLGKTRQRESSVSRFLANQYIPTLCDARRTYQRVFKAALLISRFSLSADGPKDGWHCDGLSEMEFLLGSGHQFKGTAYYRRPGEDKYIAHHAYLDFNLLPVSDPYLPPSETVDSRVEPSAQRQAALFDTWERLFDYTHLRGEVRQLRRDRKPGGHHRYPSDTRGTVWVMFYEAGSQHQLGPPSSHDDAANLALRHCGVDVGLKDTLLNYVYLKLPPADSNQRPEPDIHHILAVPDLQNERWTTRLWHARAWAKRLADNFQTDVLERARPALWAADDDALGLGTVVPEDTDTNGNPVPSQSGVHNLIRFVQYSLLGIDPDRHDGVESACGEVNRLSALKTLNDGLRLRARDALVAFLCQMGRVPLPFGGSGHETGDDTSTTPRDLVDLLLLDVEARLDGRTTRIQDGIVAAQRLVTRLRIGLEPQLRMTPGDRSDLDEAWEGRLASFQVWSAHTRRTLYAENWATWDELRVLETTEAGWFLTQALRRDTSTLAAPGRPVWFSAGVSGEGDDEEAPATSGLEMQQADRDLATLGRHKDSTLENLLLMATPDNIPRPTLLSVGLKTVSQGATPASNTPNTTDELRIVATRTYGVHLPFWIESAIRLGARFLRVAAAGRPPAFVYDSSKVPVVDEYYFWLAPANIYSHEDAPQNADIGTSSADDPSAPAWADPDPEADEKNTQDTGSLGITTKTKTAQRLTWKPRPATALFWACVHNGCLLAPRRSATYVKATQLPNDGRLHLELVGRCMDSLFFTVAGDGSDDDGHPQAQSSTPLGTALGFRYDLASDEAVALPQSIPDVFAPHSSWFSSKGPFASFPAYPRFVYFASGTPLAPTTAFGAALAMAGKLRDNGCFSAALDWYRTAFDPLARDNSWALCSRSSATGGTVILDSPCCPATADSSLQPKLVRSRAVLLEYLETMLQWSDNVADTSTEAEAAQLAQVLAETMARLLGPAPATVIAHPDSRIEQNMSVSSFFSAASPLNPRLLRLYDQVTDRLSTLNRRQNSGHATPAALSCLSFNCPPSPSSLQGEMSGASQPYRFTAVFPKAVELTGLVRGLASSLISAYERGDGAYISALRASHERTLLELGISTAQQQWRAADWEVDALQQAMKAALARRRYYVALRDGGLMPGEESHVTGTETAMSSSTAANVSEGLGQVFSLIPDLATGVAGMGPLVKTELPIGTKMAAATGAVARVLNTVASISTSQAGLSLTRAGWDRRLFEWRHQAELAQVEIAQVKRQRLAAERRRASALRELNAHERQREHAEEVMAFERDRHSRHALHLFLQRETAALLRATFSLALRTAREAHAAFLFERVPPGTASQPFPTGADLWDDTGGGGGGRRNSAVHAGLMAGERLDLALRRLEHSYMALNGRELELSKRISLRERFPRAFLALRQRGTCEIGLPESIFDADYPGHYLRRLRSVTVSVPCVAGPYTGVHCELRLLGSSVRTEPLVPPRAASCSSCGCCGRGSGQGEKESRGSPMSETDPYVVHRYTSSSAVATSHGQDDSGLFELSFRDERYLPFEYEGAMSRWCITLPRRYNLFDFSSLSDVVLSLNYTARDGGPILRRLALDRLSGCVAAHLHGGDGHGSCGSSNALWRGFEIRREFSDLWPPFARSSDAGCEECRCASLPRCPHTFDVPLRLRRGMFPFFPGRKSVRITTLCVSVSLRRPCQNSLDIACHCTGKRCPRRHFPVVFVPPGKEHCREKWRAVECVEQQLVTADIEEPWANAGGEYDDVFSCEIGDLNLGPVSEERGFEYRSRDNDQQTYGLLRFPRRMREVVDAWLLCGYEVVDCCGEGSRKKGAGNIFDGKGQGGRRPTRKYFAEDSEGSRL
ncbi:uncharacterized protein J7T54_000024 [Emericellopsis cladophorae]|uniref:Uncharacterized protein n=1 Tax=Emericellopsis cladophorae TaxID=2686198 RepID=A0A9P9XU88_9HYPO|nr:uncharacterized protein J7T54_000024 [Emericellopsis cladophorae]KAI6777886.1 hypothetical protein J7T54_000024 [Emericellopsis cladophorae]